MLTNQPLNAIHDNDAQRTLVTVVEYFGYRGYLLLLRIANHAVRRHQLDKGELRRSSDGGSQRRLARPREPM